MGAAADPGRAGPAPDETVDESVDRLYGLPLDEFTQARNDAAAGLRKAGRRDDAALVKALRRPTVAAGAVNRLVREHRAEVEEFLRSAAALRDAQLSGTGDLAAATRQEQEALARLTGIGGEAVRQTLLAAAVDDDAAEQLLEARLEAQLEPRGFGTLSFHAPPAPDGPSSEAESQAAPAKTRRPDDREARVRLEQAGEALRTAEAEEADARRRWDLSVSALGEARAAVEQAQRDLDRLQEDLTGR